MSPSLVLKCLCQFVSVCVTVCADLHQRRPKSSNKWEQHWLSIMKLKESDFKPKNSNPNRKGRCGRVLNLTCDTYPVQSLRMHTIHSSFHNRPDLRWYVQEDKDRKREREREMFYFKVLSKYVTQKKKFATGLFIVLKKWREYKTQGCTLFAPLLFYVCVKDCSGITLQSVIYGNIGNTYRESFSGTSAEITFQHRNRRILKFLPKAKKNCRQFSILPK